MSEITLIENIDDFIDKAVNNEVEYKTYFYLGENLQKSVKYKKWINDFRPKVIIFVFERNCFCKVIELKDGDAFDTKKSQGEKEHLEKFATIFGAKIPFATDYFICSFNQDSKDAIKIGFKNVFDYENILTGRELCEILKIDYDNIIKIRKQDSEENLHYFIDQLLLIPEVKDMIEKKL